MNNITNFFAENFSSFIWLAVFILALLPIAESKIAFPFSINETLLKENAMPPLLGFITCFFASIFLTLFLLTFFKSISKIIRKIKFVDKIFNKIDKKTEKQSKKIKNKNNKYIYLALFVLIPLPLTGIWSGCLISNLLNLDFKKSLVSIVLGNLGCLIILFILNLFLKDFTLAFLIISFILTFIILIILHLKNKKMNIKFLTD